ncbi:hypothetical protein SOVF_211930 isoform B [Spinacia oleracea]|uniref:Uncharacterized protein isoform X2 n=1 Tax=Spinacia oleracea TaxID=3562 RepID=A0A9R0IGM8_SPIOL|nr:uncharacterized protein LOC110788486 isoform X2 [Spinacia oleracea]XP_056696587.1 uncharacterized protein LOC110788486 isoform X2 [Spinacia oleracea]KNA03151.1 hypothetical protein SOVF_211930 isoform B [Spinacia oleracea]
MPTSYLDSLNPVSPQLNGGSTHGSEPDELNVETIKAAQLKKLGHHTREFFWLGSQWTCKKKRKHYQAFRRNGVKVTVNQFVHVLAEENKRLIAYLDDMYEDAKGNKMVVVRWFHKIDEVGIDLPHNYNDREILFSLCLQDLSVECIDGFAMVLCPRHYAKFVSGAEHAMLQPYMCCQQYDSDDLKPLDITQVKGYWKQDVVRYMFAFSSERALENTCLPEDPWKKEDISAFNGCKPRKRLRLSREVRVDLQGVQHMAVGSVIEVAVDSVVEVLSQDSGMRGCWFRATIIKKHKNKVKLRYHDIKDGENEANCLEEWVLASRIAVNDAMNLRLEGRTTIRPSVTHNGKVSWVINSGSIVDAWWHNGWWEGIVIQKEANGKFLVYFPGEQREALFSRSDLRHSQEWVKGGWKELSERADVAASILSGLVKEGRFGKQDSYQHLQTLVSKHPEYDVGKGYSCWTKDCSNKLRIDTWYKKAKNSTVTDLSKDDYLSQLKWESSCKRKRSGFVVPKLQPRRRLSSEINHEKRSSCEKYQEFLTPSTLKVEKERRNSVKVDLDNCKYITDALFTPSVVPSLTSLVMSR